MAKSNKEPSSKEYIKSLPILSVKMSGKVHRGHYDTEAKKFYLIDDNNELTGMFAEANLDIILANTQEKATETEKDFLSNSSSSELTQEQQTDIPPSPAPKRANPETAEIPPQPALTPVDLTPKIRNKEIPVVDPQKEADTEQQNQNEQKRSSKRRKKWVLIFLVVLVLILLTWFSGAAKIIMERTGILVPNESTAPMQTEAGEITTGPEQDNDATTNPSEVIDETIDGIYVLAAIDTFLPGHIISETDFDLVQVTESEFRALGAAGGIYTSENLPSLSGLAIVNYVSCGKYLSYDDVGISYSPLNPWAGSRETVVTLPLQLVPGDYSTVLWGNEVTLEIEVQSKYTAPIGGEDGEESTYPPGIEHDSSTVESTIINKYIIKDALIVDVLNVDTQSLYIRYKSLSSIPIVFLQDTLMSEYANKMEIQKDIPYYMNVGVSTDQGVLLQQILFSDYQSLTVRIISVRMDANSEVQNTTYTALQEVGKAIAENWVAAASVEE